MSATGISVGDLLSDPRVSWLMLDGWHGRIAIPVVVIRSTEKTSTVRLLRRMQVHGRSYPANTIKDRVPNSAIVGSFVGSIPPALCAAEVEP